MLASAGLGDEVEVRVQAGQIIIAAPSARRAGWAAAAATCDARVEVVSRSPLDVPGLALELSRDELLAIVREGRRPA